MKIILFLAFMVVISVAYAHVDELRDNFDIHLSPQEVFQKNEIAIQAEITKNGIPVNDFTVYFVIDKHETGLSNRIRATEREPGYYFIKYEFENSGPHEIHVEFVNDGQEIRKTFDIDVAGSDTEQYLIIAMAFLLSLATLEGFVSKKYKRSIIAGLIIFAAFGLGYSVYVLYATGAAQRGVIGCVGTDCYWSAHIHAQADVVVCGEEHRFPIEKGRLDEPHTHEEKNLIHFHERLLIDPQTKEIQDARRLTVGAFFDQMETRFDETHIMDRQNGGLCNGKPGSVKMFVNGKPDGNFRDYIWKDGDKIHIIFDENPAPSIEKRPQTATAELTPELTLPIIVGFALIDSINPCVIGVLLLLITVLLKSNKKRTILVKGTAYSIGVYLTYLLGGLTLLSIFNAVREVQSISQLFYVVVGILVFIAAFLEIKDYFWYGRGFSMAIPKQFINTIEGAAKNAHTGILSAVAFGAIVTLIELPCTGAPYLAILTLMSQSGIEFYNALLLLLLYNLIFVLPLIVIIYLAYRGIGYKKMELWRREHKGRMRLAVGLMLLGISVWIITTVFDWLLAYLISGSIVVIAAMYVLKRMERKRW